MKVGPRKMTVLSPDSWVDEHGDALYAYARTRLRNQSTAEDVVQETFLAALKARHNFSGRSSERTWMVGILRHKIVDAIRTEGRALPVDDTDELRGHMDGFYDPSGHWKTPPVTPRKALENGELRERLQACISSLPALQYEAFVLRELEGLSAEEVCRTLNITRSNLYVTLHRARMQLREKLNTFTAQIHTSAQLPKASSLHSTKEFFTPFTWPEKACS